MRKFKLINEYGVEYNLQGNIPFFYDPSGLGYSFSVTYEETTGHFIETYREVDQVEKIGTFIFSPPNAYGIYMDFVNFITTSGNLTLGYCPQDTWYYVDVDIISLEKTELSTGGVLKVPVIMAPTSPFYAPYNINLSIDKSLLESTKQYDYTYPYRYANSSRSGVLNFSVAAQIPCDFTISIPTPISAPIITAIRMDTGDTFGEIDLSALTLNVGETLLYSTVPKVAGAQISSSSGTRDVSDLIGLSSEYPSFFQIPPNIPIEFVLEATSLNDVIMNLSIYRYYRTV